MKRSIIFFVAIALLTSIKSFAQCSDVANNFELKLTQTTNHTLSVSIRHNREANARALTVAPSTKYKLDGLVFAIAWPKSSNNVNIVSCENVTKPFDLVIDKQTVQASQARKIAEDDNYITFYHQGDILPMLFTENWTDGNWYEIAKIEFTGNLATNDFFSLMTCDYGLAHPNSYYGNSHTDPWFSMFDENGEYLQFSPSMITEKPALIAGENTFSLYPNPASSEINIDIESQVSSQVAILLYDIQGKLVKNITYKLFKGTNNTVVNVADLAQGNYTIKITDGKTINYSQTVSKI